MNTFTESVWSGMDRQRGLRREKQTQNALAGYADNPDQSLRNFLAVDAPSAIPLIMRREQERAAVEQRQLGVAERRREQAMKAYGFTTDALKRVREANGDLGMAFDELDRSGYLDTIGMPPEQKQQYRSAIIANPALLDALGNVSDDKGVVVSGGGMGFVVDPRTGKELFRTPRPNFKLGEGEQMFDYGDTTQPGGGAARGGPLTVEALKPHFVAQESGGNYAAKNASTGALGAYQVMPETGAALAKRLGLPWRPDMMTKTDPASKRYQDEIGSAAIQEAIDNSGGDPTTAFSYYYGGSNRKQWGPKTRQYAQEMGARFGGGQPAGPRPVAQGAPKPKTEIVAPEEVAAMNLDPAMVYQRKPDGSIVPVGGQAKPGAAGKDGAYSQSALDAFDRAIDSGNRLLKHEGLSAAVGAPNPFGGNFGFAMVPGTRSADFRAELDAMKAQVFLPMVQSMKGMGALSNAEGEKLTAAIGALDMRMSEGKFKDSLNRIIKDLQTYKARGMKGPPGQAAGDGNLPRLSPQQAAKLPPGTPFIGVDGKRRIRN